jgi:hypothetical protein
MDAVQQRDSRWHRGLRFLGRLFWDVDVCLALLAALAYFVLDDDELALALVLCLGLWVAGYGILPDDPEVRPKPRTGGGTTAREFLAILYSFALLLLLWGSMVLCYLGILVLAAVAGQVTFVLGGGTVDLAQPSSKSRLVPPVLVTSLILAALLWGFIVELGELLPPIQLRLGIVDTEVIVVAPIIGAFVISACVLYGLAGSWPRYLVLLRFVKLLMWASLLEILAVLAAVTFCRHVLHDRVDAFGPGVSVGWCVMFWSIGPALAVSYLHARYLDEKALEPVYCPTCEHDLRGMIAVGEAICPVCKTVISTRKA